ncbi:MAG: hypothetical protein AAFV88_25555, partial [Planctomycetota bacterium]
MPRPQRAEQFDPAEVCVVHVVQRCVRRAFLAGVDYATGKDYSFRKEWIRRRMEALASVFAVDVLSYAVMYRNVPPTILLTAVSISLRFGLTCLEMEM